MAFMLSAIARTRFRLSHLIPVGIAIWLAGCADGLMTYNVVTYDSAVADTANQSILLNAVRASQHYPMSFTSVGPVLATPPVSGSVAGTFNFANNGLTGITANPTVTAGGGYQTFALDNLNYQSFMEALREPISYKIVGSFYQNTIWPREMLWLVYVQELMPSPVAVMAIDSHRKKECADPLPTSLCIEINKSIDLYSTKCEPEHFNDNHFKDIRRRLLQISKDPDFYYNTAINECRFLRMKIFLEEMRLLRVDPCPFARPRRAFAGRCVPATFRSAQRMIEYLGELIAAQLYIEDAYLPKMSLGVSRPIGFRFEEVPLFVVQRGVGPLRPAVVVHHAGGFYSIPEPDFGSPTEARSLQVLDLVLQTVRAATHREDLAKLPSLGIIAGK